MSEWFAQLSAYGIFLGIAAIGFLYLLLSLIFGEVFEHFGGGDFDHGDMDHGLEHGGPSFFSPRVLSVFITAFGGSGAIATHYGLRPLPASGVGFASGLVFGTLIYWFARLLYAQQSSSEVSTKELLGQTARVVVAIPAGGVGQVRCRIGEELIDKIARAHDNAAIPENAVVRIEELLGEVVVVRRA
jgi:membrane protein implicated in regulation of membrane protease activity